MGCYNCGYEVSVVSKDDIGWLCEWCSDNRLRSPIIKRLKKLIFSDTNGLLIFYLEELIKLQTNAKYPSYKIEQALEFLNQCRELQKILGDKHGL